MLNFFTAFSPCPIVNPYISGASEKEPSSFNCVNVTFIIIGVDSLKFLSEAL